MRALRLRPESTEDIDMSQMNEDLARDRARQILRDRLAAGASRRDPEYRRPQRRRLFPR
ncbi:hypothetical protein GCM10009818_06890 [Nakamurella flavida]